MVSKLPPGGVIVGNETQTRASRTWVLHNYINGSTDGCTGNIDWNLND